MTEAELNATIAAAALGSGAAEVSGTIDVSSTVSIPTGVRFRGPVVLRASADFVDAAPVLEVTGADVLVDDVTLSANGFLASGLRVSASRVRASGRTATSTR